MSIDEFLVLCVFQHVLIMLKLIEIFFHIGDTDIFCLQYDNPYVQLDNVYEQNLFHIAYRYMVFHLIVKR